MLLVPTKSVTHELEAIHTTEFVVEDRVGECNSWIWIDCMPFGITHLFVGPYEASTTQAALLHSTLTTPKNAIELCAFPKHMHWPLPDMCSFLFHCMSSHRLSGNWITDQHHCKPVHPWLCLCALHFSPRWIEDTLFLAVGMGLASPLLAVRHIPDCLPYNNIVNDWLSMCFISLRR